MKALILIISVTIVLHAERIAVVNVISHNQKFSSAFITSLQAHLPKHFTVVERDRIATILEQQGLRLTGLMDENVPHIEDVDKIITGIVAPLGDSTFYVALKLIDVNVCITLKSDYYVVKGSLVNVINTSTYAIDRLFKTNSYKQYQPVIVETKIEVEPKSEVKQKFIPCNFCQGRGKLHDGKDCPYCDAHYHYTGIETNYQSLTGNWR